LKQVSRKSEQHAANADTGLDSSASVKKSETVCAQLPAFIDMIAYIQNKVVFNVILFETGCNFAL
jgi:hypothetical protein